MYNRIRRPRLFKRFNRILIGAFMLMAIAALAACGSDPTATTRPTAQPTATQVSSSTGSSTVTATNPSVADLAGGSPEVFLKGF